MSSSESMLEDSLPRNAPRPSVTVTEACAKPVVPEVSLIFDKLVNKIESGSHIVTTLASDGECKPQAPVSECPPEIQPFGSNFYQKSALNQENCPSWQQTNYTLSYNQPQYRLSLPYKSYSAFRGSPAGNISHNARDLSRKQVRFETSSSTINYKRSEVNTQQAKQTFQGPTCPSGTNYRPFRPSEQMLQNRAIIGGFCPKINNDENENCAGPCCLSPPTKETAQLFELVRHQGEQIRLLEQQVMELKFDVISVRKHHAQDLDEIIKFVRNTIIPVAQFDKSTQCLIDEEIKGNQPLGKLLPSDCQVKFVSTTSAETTNSSTPSTAPWEQNRQNAGSGPPKSTFYNSSNQEESIEPRSVQEFMANLPPPKTDRSLAMYDLTLKYLPQDKIKELVSKEDNKKEIPTQAYVDMSLASLRYLEKYGLAKKCMRERSLSPKSANIEEHQKNNDNFLDVTAIKRQPKLL